MSSQTEVKPAQNCVPNYIAHIGLTTKNMEAMHDWYSRWLLVKDVYRDPNLAFTTFDDEHHRVVLIALPDSAPDKDPNAAGFAHLSFSFNDLEDLVNFYEHAKGEGILPILPINHGPTTSLYYMDPDGNQMEVQWDNFRTPEESKAFFASDTFLANPVGLIYDPDVFSTGIRAGRSWDEAMKEAIEAGDQSLLPPAP